jgi:hypothetical protein
MSLGNAIVLQGPSFATNVINANGKILTLGGVISGGGNLQLRDSVGTGSFALRGSNSYTGPTVINGVAVGLGNGSALGAS